MTTWGLIGGALPGISSSMAVVLILPFTYKMDSMAAIAVMIAVYVGGACGGSISAILLKTPGTPEALCTTFDGHPLAMQGNTGLALGLAITASSFGSIFSAIVMMFATPLLSKAALSFQSAEYFGMALIGLSCISSIGSKDRLKSITSAFLGLLVSTIGIDPINGIERFTFGRNWLETGVDFIPVIIGCFAFSEVMITLENYSTKDHESLKTKVSMKLLSVKKMFSMWKTFLVSAVIGTIIGILPAAGGTIGSMVSYGAAVKMDKNPERFGKGAYEGIIAAETANNGAVGGSMVPTLTLGIPGSGTAAIILSAFMIHGLVPGPLLMREQPHMLYTILISILITSILLFFIGRFVSREFGYILKLPYPILAAVIVGLGIVGSLALKGSYYDLLLAAIFTAIGYLFHKFHFQASSFILGVVLGKTAETSFRRQLLLSGNSIGSFFSRPIAAILIIVSLIIFFYPYIAPLFKRKKNEA
jgi:putative tricarboxylic transport membrane protein